MTEWGSRYNHGHIEYTANLLPNTEFEKLGWVSSSKPEEYRIYCHGCGISAQIYMRDASLSPQAEELFTQWKQEGYLLDYYTRGQAAQMGLDGDFSYVLEAADGYSIISSFQGPFVCKLKLPEGVTSFGNHGHLPCRGNKPPFMVSSPLIMGYTEIEEGKMLDIAPTICVMHGVTPWSVHGSPMKAITRYYE